MQLHLEAMQNERSGLFPFGLNGPRAILEKGIYSMTWDDASVTIDFDFVTTERRTGETYAELSIYFPDSVDPFAMQRTRLNLLSTDRRDRLAKGLAERSTTKLDWRKMLDQAVQWVMTEHRNGEPAVMLPDVEEPEHAEKSLLPPLLAEDGATILFGDGGASKSYLALAIGATLQSGFDVIPQMEPTELRQVAYCDWEWSAHVHKRRLRRLMGDVDMPRMLYVPCRLSLREERDRLRRIFRQNKINFMIVDSVALAAGGEPESAEIAVGFFAALRELDVPSLLIAHVTNAAAKSGADRPFGSAFWHNSARSTWYVKRAEEQSGDTLAIGLYHRKTNDSARSMPIGLTWHHEQDRTYIVRSNVEAVASLESELPTGKRIELLLRGGPMTIADICEQTDLSVGAVRMALQRGRGTRFVQAPGKQGDPATWALMAREEVA